MREYYENEWMPKVLPLGVKFDEFWALNPRKINILIKAFNEKTKTELKQQNMLMHLQGMYMVDALLATVGNMFRGKSQKAFQYPKEPYTFDFDYEEGLEEKDRDIAIKRRDFVTQLNNLFRDMERNHGNR